MIESKITSRINDYCYYYVGQQYVEQCTLKSLDKGYHDSSIYMFVLTYN